MEWTRDIPAIGRLWALLTSTQMWTPDHQDQDHRYDEQYGRRQYFEGGDNTVVVHPTLNIRRPQQLDGILALDGLLKFAFVIDRPPSSLQSYYVQILIDGRPRHTVGVTSLRGRFDVRLDKIQRNHEALMKVEFHLYDGANRKVDENCIEVLAVPLLETPARTIQAVANGSSTLCQMGRPGLQGAIRVLSAALRQFGRDPTLLYRMGICMAISQQYQQALNYLDLAVQAGLRGANPRMFEGLTNNPDLAIVRQTFPAEYNTMLESAGQLTNDMPEHRGNSLVGGHAAAASAYSAPSHQMIGGGSHLGSQEQEQAKMNETVKRGTMIANALESSTTDEGLVWQDIRCGYCGIAPLRGVRYCCYTCKDSNLCSVCYAERKQRHDPQHNFQKWDVGFMSFMLGEEIRTLQEAAENAGRLNLGSNWKGVIDGLVNRLNEQQRRRQAAKAQAHYAQYPQHAVQNAQHQHQQPQPTHPAHNQQQAPYPILHNPPPSNPTLQFPQPPPAHTNDNNNLVLVNGGPKGGSGGFAAGGMPLHNNPPAGHVQQNPTIGGNQPPSPPQPHIQPPQPHSVMMPPGAGAGGGVGAVQPQVETPASVAQLWDLSPEFKQAVAKGTMGRVQQWGPSSWAAEVVEPANPAVASLFNAKEIPLASGYQISQVFLVFNDDRSARFGTRILELDAQQRHNPGGFMTPGLENGPATGEVLRRFRQQEKKHKSTNVGVVRGWHGTSFTRAKFLCGQGPGEEECNVDDRFGRGMFMSTSAEHALMYARQTQEPALVLLNSVVGNVFPVTAQDGLTFKGKSPHGNFDAHYALVASQDGAQPTPVLPGQPHQYDELVIFNQSAILPRLVVLVQPTRPRAPPAPAPQTLLHNPMLGGPTPQPPQPPHAPPTIQQPNNLYPPHGNPAYGGAGMAAGPPPLVPPPAPTFVAQNAPSVQMPPQHNFLGMPQQPQTGLPTGPPPPPPPPPAMMAPHAALTPAPMAGAPLGHPIQWGTEQIAQWVGVIGVPDTQHAQEVIRRTSVGGQALAGMTCEMWENAGLKSNQVRKMAQELQKLGVFMPH